MNRFQYSGPVESFGRCVETKWNGETIAPSEKKARANLSFRWKREHGYTQSARITLPGHVEMLPEGE